jgi:hypothetical protein
MPENAAVQAKVRMQNEKCKMAEALLQRMTRRGGEGTEPGNFR